MFMKCRWFSVTFALALLLGGFFLPGINACDSNPPIDDRLAEGRAIWTVVFDPLANPADIETLMDLAKNQGYNTILFQVRFRGDTFYIPNRSDATFENPEPPSRYLKTPLTKFDPLQYAIDYGHERGLEIHAYVNYAVVTESSAPSDPNHVYNAHPEFITYRYSGGTTRPMLPSEGDGAYIDPGVPAANEYTQQVFLDIIKNYDIDGIHLDHIRYPQTQWDRSIDWGYNPTAVERFNLEYNLSGLPDPADTRWIEWRQRQVSGFVRDFYSAATALKPWLKISASVIARTPDFYDSLNYCYQNWPLWMSEGWLDIAVPMIYNSDTDDVAAVMAACIDARQDRLLYAGLRAYGSSSFPPASLVTNIETAQQQKQNGVALFRYGTAVAEGYTDAIESAGLFSEPAKPPATDFKAGYDEIAPEAVSKITAKPEATDSILVRWVEPDRASDRDLPSRYELYRSNAPNVNTYRYANLIGSYAPARGAIIDTPAEPGQYYYKVVGYDDYNRRSADSPEVTAKTGDSGQPVVPDIVIESNDSAGNPNVAPAYQENSGWAYSTSKSSASGLTASGARYTSDSALTAQATFTPNIETAGKYEVFVTFGQSANASNVGYSIQSKAGSTTIYLDQDGWGASGESNANRWLSLGVYNFPKGEDSSHAAVMIDESSVSGKPSPGNNGRVYADAVKWVYLP
jgi:uncharacterized lipoprotein YddW (UPF0748 family)